MELTPKQRKKLEKIAKVVTEGGLAIAEYLLELEDKFEETVEQIKKDVPNLDKILESIRGEDGDDYVLTDEDITSIANEVSNTINIDDVASKIATKVPVEEIAQRVADKAAQKIKVPVVEKVIEKTEVVREIPQTVDVEEAIDASLTPKLTEQEERIKKAIKEYTDELFDIFKEDNTQAQNGYTDEVKTLQNRTQLLLQIATQRTNTTSSGGTSTDAWKLTGNAGTTAGTNFLGTTDDTDFVLKTNGLERLRLKSYGASDIAEWHVGSSTTPDGRIYFRDGQTEYHRIDMAKSGSNMNVTRSTAASGIAVVLNQIVGDTAGYEDFQATAVRMRARTPMRFFDESNTNYVGLRAPADANISADVTFALPATDAVRNGSAISSDKSGNLFFDYFARVLGANTANSSAIASTAAETLFDVTHTVTAGDINELGQTFLVFAQGRASTSGTPTLTIKLKGDFSSSTTLYDSGAQTMGAGVTDRPWMFLWVVTVRASGGSGQIHSSPIVNRIDARNSNNAKASAVVDLSLGCQFGISAQWSASSASNTTTLESFVVLALNKR